MKWRWSWWLPWRREADQAAKQALDEALTRLEESEEFKRKAAAAERRLRIHLRRNRFGEMIQREVFGGDE